MADEKRSGHRVRMTGVRVTYDNAGVDVEADAVDLAAGGLFIRTAAPLPVGKRIALEIHVIGEPGPWSVLGRVVWARDKGEGDQAPPGMGVKLIDADDGVIASIERIVETRERTEPGLGGPGSNPPPPIAAPQREATIQGVGPAVDRTPPPAREQSIAIDLATRKTPPRPEASPPARTTPGGGGGRWVVVLLLLIVAAIAAYVLIDGFLKPPR
jgi:uncharacterized protein (TIGR02266 family)